MRRLNGRVEALERLIRPRGPRIFARTPDGSTYVLVGPTISVIPPAHRGPNREPGVDWLASQPGSWRRVRPGEPIDETRLHDVADLAVFAKGPPLLTNTPTTGPGSPTRVKLESITDKHRRKPIARSRD